MKSFPIEQECAPAKFGYMGQDGLKASFGSIRFYSQDAAEAMRVGKAFYYSKSCVVTFKTNEFIATGCKDVPWQESDVTIDRDDTVDDCTMIMVRFYND